MYTTHTSHTQTAARGRLSSTHATVIMILVIRSKLRQNRTLVVVSKFFLMTSLCWKRLVSAERHVDYCLSLTQTDTDGHRETQTDAHRQRQTETETERETETDRADLRRTGLLSSPCLNSARLHNMAMRANACHVGEFLSYSASTHTQTHTQTTDLRQTAEKLLNTRCHWSTCDMQLSLTAANQTTDNDDDDDDDDDADNVSMRHQSALLADLLSTFWRQLKHYLFEQSYPDVVL